MDGYRSDGFRKRIPCSKCTRTFRTRDALRRHQGKEHRRDYESYKEHALHTIPTAVATLRVSHVFKVGMQPPAGFRPEQLPLAVVSYDLGTERVRKVVCSYQDVQDRFPRDLCSYFERRIQLIPYEARAQKLHMSTGKFPIFTNFHFFEGPSQKSISANPTIPDLNKPFGQSKSPSRNNEETKNDGRPPPETEDSA